MKRVAGLGLLLGLAGCAGIFHSSAQREQVYFLGVNPAAPLTAALPAARASLRVARPVAGPGLDSSHIVLLESSHRMSYYMASRWPATLPEVVETLATQVLNASGAWTSVQGSQSPFPSDYLLQMRIRRFEADYTGGSAAPEVHVVLDCTLGRQTGREIVDTFVSEGSAVAAANKLSDVVAAFEQATGAALTSMAAHAGGSAHGGPDQNVERPVPSMKR